MTHPLSLNFSSQELLVLGAVSVLASVLLSVESSSEVSSQTSLISSHHSSGVQPLRKRLLQSPDSQQPHRGREL